MHRISVLAALALSVMLAASVPTSVAQDPSVKKRTLRMTWSVTKANDRSTAGQLDRFAATGKPFGTSKASTVTKNAERGLDVVHPSFEIENKKGWVAGTLTIKKTYLKTTKTYQRTRYEGTGTIDRGSSSSPYALARGKITSFSGVITCRTSGKCTGELEVTGSVSY